MSEESNTNGEPVKAMVETHETLEESVWSWLPAKTAGVNTSLKLDTDDGRRDLVKGIQGKGIKFDELINLDVDIRDVLVHPAESVSPVDGEVNRFTRVVVYFRDGTFASCGSRGVLKSLALGAILFGPPPWKAARGKVQQEKIGLNRDGTPKQWLTIQWDLDAKTEPTKSGRAR